MRPRTWAVFLRFCECTFCATESARARRGGKRANWGHSRADSGYGKSVSTNYPKTNEEKATLYANAVHEIRMRLQFVEKLRVADMPPLFLYESCQLQLRMCCELFAVACLAAQGDFETHKAFRERYEPPAIFKVLEDHYPNFYPKPSSRIKTVDGWHMDLDTRPSRPLAIDRIQMEKIWSLAGSHLHRASVKRYIARTNAVDVEEIRKATEAFWDLVIDHSIVLSPVPLHAHVEGDQPPKIVPINDLALWTILHVQMDRQSDDMRLTFLHVDRETSTIKAEEFTVQTAEAAASPEARTPD
jgi:hypothetical protein